MNLNIISTQEFHEGNRGQNHVLSTNSLILAFFRGIYKSIKNQIHEGILGIISKQNIESNTPLFGPKIVNWYSGGNG